MATATILDSAPPYYTIRVSVLGAEYDQHIVSSNTGAALKKQLQGYADNMEAEILARQKSEEG